MTRKFERIRDDAMELSVEERGWLYEQLWDSTRTAREREIEQAWLEECERRYRDWKAGRAQSFPGEEVLAQLRRKYRGDDGY